MDSYTKMCSSTSCSLSSSIDDDDPELVSSSSTGVSPRGMENDEPGEEGTSDKEEGEEGRAAEVQARRVQKRCFLALMEYRISSGILDL